MRIWDCSGNFIEPRPASICSTGIEEGLALAGASMASASPYLAAGSIGMNILGGIGQSNSQRAAGEAAYQTALTRRNMAMVEAQQLEQNAGQQEAAGQRQAIEARRKGMLQAARLRAVMGASGAGIDNNLLASLQGEGDYAGDTALFNAGERARGLRNQAALDRWSGDASAGQGAFARSAADSAADSTLVGTIGRSALSFASKYGGSSPAPRSTGGIDSEIASWSQYGQDPNSQAHLRDLLT